MADGVGFEPTVPCGTAVFKTATIDHSDTHPFSYHNRLYSTIKAAVMLFSILSF
jgi:hypothetical protein